MKPTSEPCSQYLVVSVSGYVFVEFNKLWMHEKPNVMQFNEIRDKYEKIMLTQLKSEKALLLIESQTTSLDTSDITH